MWPAPSVIKLKPFTQAFEKWSTKFQSTLRRRYRTILFFSWHLIIQMLLTLYTTGKSCISYIGSVKRHHLSAVLQNWSPICLPRVSLSGSMLLKSLRVSACYLNWGEGANGEVVGCLVWFTCQVVCCFEQSAAAAAASSFYLPPAACGTPPSQIPGRLDRLRQSGRRSRHSSSTLLVGERELLGVGG